MMNRPKFTMLCGLPGSGKSTWVKHNGLIYHVISSDEWRKKLYGDESIQGDPNEVFENVHKEIDDAVKNNENILLDATNISRKTRAYSLNHITASYEKECIIPWARIETCIERDSKRNRTVGKAVIDRMARGFQVPYYDEGFDNIEVCINDFQYSTEICLNNMKIFHDNPHHERDVYSHCSACFDYIRVHHPHYYETLRVAALYHDIGKPYTKSFYDTHGNKTDIAHYYGHQNVGGWMALGLDIPKNPLCPNMLFAYLVCNHMEPFFDSKYYRALKTKEPYLYRCIEILHEADVACP